MHTVYWEILVIIKFSDLARSDCNLILAEIKFGSCTARTKHDKYVRRSM